MGKAIVYCQSCGTNLREDDFDRGRAFRIENHNYCAACRPAKAAPAPAAPAPPPRDPTPPPPPRRSISDRIPVTRPAAERPGSTGRIPKAQKPPQRNSALLWISIIVVLVVGGGAFLASRSGTQETPVVTPPSPLPPSPRPQPPEPSPIERDLVALRRLLGQAPKGWNTRDLEARLRNAAEIAGPRRDEVEKLRKEYDRGLRSLDLAEGLIGRWPLDETDGTVARDASGRGHDGKIVGSPGRVPGRIGGAFQFRGGEDYVEIPAMNELDVRHAGCYTLAAWFMPEQLPSGKEEPANDSWYAVMVRQGLHVGLSLTRDGRVEMGHWLNERKQAVHYSIDRIPPKVWTHLAGIIDPRTGRTSIFINGKSSGESVWPQKAAATPLETPWRIGIALPNAKEWGWSARGLIDEVLFYDRALTPEEISLLAEGVVPPEEDPRRIEPGDAGLALHLRSDRDLKLDGTAVVSWSDPARGVDAAAVGRDERPTLARRGNQAALKFDGNNDHLVIAARPDLSFLESDSYTLVVRVHLPALPAKARWQGVIEKSLGSDSWYGIWIDDQNRWMFGSTTNLHGSPVKAGETVLVGVQEGGKERRLYVDGRRVATGPAMPANGPGSLWIGGSEGRPEYFEGEILEVRLWRRALEPAEIRALSK